MTWENFYLACFLIGLILSVLSFFFGVLNLHIPGFEALHHMHPHALHVHMPHGNVAGVSPFNFSTLMAFLAWFGGAGYLLTAWGKLGLVAVGALAVGAGFTGAMIVFLFLAKVLMRSDGILHIADYHMEGLLGRISSGIREGGTGEIIYSQEGVRRTCGARSEDGAAISKGTEVVITRYERGIAYVKKWEDLAKEAGVNGV